MAEYSTDKKVRHITNTEEDVNETLCQHLGADFVEYRKAWDSANQLDYLVVQREARWSEAVVVYSRG